MVAPLLPLSTLQRYCFYLKPANKRATILRFIQYLTYCK
nr:MAG TPA: hypothetical protein [Caudoviricetes sp.]